MSERPTFREIEQALSLRETLLKEARQAEAEAALAMERSRDARNALRDAEGECQRLIQHGAIDVISEQARKCQSDPVRRAEDAPQLKLCPPGTIVVADDGTIWERVGTSWTRLVRAVDFRQDVNDKANTATLLAEKRTVILTEPAYVYMFCNDADQLEGQPPGRIVHSIGHGLLTKEEGKGYRTQSGRVRLSSEGLAQQSNGLWESPMLILPAEVGGVKEVD